VHTATSTSAIREICNVLVNARYTPAEAAAPIEGAWRDDPLHPVGKSSYQRAFAVLVTEFVNSLAAASRTDLGKEWLLHRLHCILVEHQHPKPGEIELIRADVRARADTLRLADHEAAMLAEGVNTILHGIGQHH
jgi:hypothetical protein